MKLAGIRLAEFYPDPEKHIDWLALQQGRGTIHGDLATWWTQATAGVNYVRAEMPAKHLPGRTARVDFHVGDPSFQSGASVWMFPGNRFIAIRMAEMRSRGTPVFVEIDDNYTVGVPIKQLSSWQDKFDTTERDRYSYQVHKWIVRSGIVDGVIVSTPKLAEVYGFLHKNVHVCQNSVDPDDWPAGEPEHQPDGVLRVGWAGSASHAYDLNDIARALDWASRQKDVEVVLFGQLSLPIKHRNIPWMDSLAEYRINVSQIDVMLCPLRPGIWADCKSDVKALEASMGGAVPVVSRTEPYKPWWGEDRPCLVAGDAKGFLKAVKHLVGHRDETRATARLAREYVLSERVISKSISSWREALNVA